MRLVSLSYRTHSTRPTCQQPTFNSTGESKALYVDIRSRTPLNYWTATAVVVVSTGIPTRLTQQLLAVESPSMYGHLYDTLRCYWLFFSYRTNNTRPNPYSPTIFIPFYWRKQKACRVINFVIKNINKAKSPGSATVWYQEQHDTPRRRV